MLSDTGILTLNFRWVLERSFLNGTLQPCWEDVLWIISSIPQEEWYLVFWIALCVTKHKNRQWVFRAVCSSFFLKNWWVTFTGNSKKIVSEQIFSEAPTALAPKSLVCPGMSSTCFRPLSVTWSWFDPVHLSYSRAASSQGQWWRGHWKTLLGGKSSFSVDITMWAQAAITSLPNMVTYFYLILLLSIFCPCRRCTAFQRQISLSLNKH